MVYCFVVDEKKIIQTVPINEIAFYAGTKECNLGGIVIEIFKSGNEGKAKEHAERLMRVSDLLCKQPRITT